MPTPSNRRGPEPRGSIRPRGPDTYEARIRLGGEDHTKTFHGPTASEDAAAWLLELRRAHRQGRLEALAGAAGRTVRRQVELYLDALAGQGADERLIAEHRRNLLNHLEALHGLTLEELSATPERWRRHQAFLLSAEHRNPPLKPRTVLRVRSTLRQALRLAVDDGLLTTNVVDRVRPPRTSKPAQCVLSRQEQARLLAEAERRAAVPQSEGGARLAGLWALALRIGGRMSELIGLTWADVDLERGTVTIRRQLAGKDERGGPVWKERAKSEAGTRLVHLPRSAREALVRHRARQDGERVRFASLYADYGLVFATRYGRPLTKGAVYKQWHRACRHAGVPVVRFHETRHTAASTYLGAGVTLAEVSQILGHATPAITAKIYAAWVERSTKHAADAMDAFLDASEAENPPTLGETLGGADAAGA